MQQEKILEIRRQLEEDIDNAEASLEMLQRVCTHPNKDVKYKSNTGNYDPSCDRYWIENKCPDCNKFWIEDQ